MKAKGGAKIAKYFAESSSICFLIKFWSCELKTIIPQLLLFKDVIFIVKIEGGIKRKNGTQK